MHDTSMSHGVAPGFPQAPPPVDGLGDPNAGYAGGTASAGTASAGSPAAVGNTADGSGGVGDDVGTVLPQPDLVTLLSGRQVRVKKLKSRELFALVGIAVSGIGGQLGNLKLDPNAPPAEFVAKFAGLTLAAAFTPEGSDQVFAFLRLVCEPVGKITEGRIDKAVKARNDALDAALDAELANPEPDDTITLVEAVARNNAADLQTWGKRLAGIWNLATRTGQIPASPTSQA